MAINPGLSAQEMIDLIRQSVESQGSSAGEFASAEVINEEKALLLARATVQQ